MKRPVTDPTKNSKAGRLALVKTATGYDTVRADELAWRDDQLREVFLDGVVVNRTTLAEVRQRAALVPSAITART